MKNIYKNPMFIAALLTLLYFLLLYLLLTRVEACKPLLKVTDFEISPTGDWLHQILHCHSFNELGDFLAGAFAPVAFLWLIVAVYIQSRELAAQRAELSLTREEMEVSNSRLNHHSHLLEDAKFHRNRDALIEQCQALLVSLFETIGELEATIIYKTPASHTGQLVSRYSTNDKKFSVPKQPNSILTARKSIGNFHDEINSFTSTIRLRQQGHKNKKPDLSYIYISCMNADKDLLSTEKICQDLINLIPGEDLHMTQLFSIDDIRAIQNCSAISKSQFELAVSAFENPIE